MALSCALSGAPQFGAERAVRELLAEGAPSGRSSIDPAPTRKPGVAGRSVEGLGAEALLVPGFSFRFSSIASSSRSLASASEQHILAAQALA